jgi:hypothetical protein
MMPTIPSGAEQEVAFLSGVTDAGKVAATAYATWKQNPIFEAAAYKSTTSDEAKWGIAEFGSSGGIVSYWFDATSDWQPTEKAAIAACLALWSAEANISFVPASEANVADQIFFRAGKKQTYQVFKDSTASQIGSDAPGKASKSQIYIDTHEPGWSIGKPFDEAGGYGWQTVVHETGHMLGLGHGGPYNGGSLLYSQQQFSAYDTRLWTLMSYFNPTDAAKFSNTYPVTGTAWGTTKLPPPSDNLTVPFGPTTPMILDILAIQRVYGEPTSGPLVSGGQVFGFNSNIEDPVRQFFDFTANRHPVVTLWDKGIGNTLDLSGFSEQSTINLNPGTFSSANGMRNNIAIATDTVIEKAIGGPGNDRFMGSPADNVFIGNHGDDTIDGGAGTDMAIFSGQRSQYTLTALSDHGVKVAGPDGTDVLKSVERLKFDDQTVDWPLAPSGGDNQANGLTDLSNPFGQVPLGQSVGGNLEAKADRDLYAVELLAGQTYTIGLTGVQDGGGALTNPHARLYSSSGTPVAESDDIAPGSNLASQITFVPTETSTYYIEVGASEDNFTGGYELSLSSVGSEADDFANDLTDMAHPMGLLSVGLSSVGKLEVPTDRDWFRVKLEAGETYDVSLMRTLDGDGGLADSYLRLHDSTGVVVGENDDIVGGDSTDSELVFEATETGFFYVEAGSYQDRYQGSYTVGVAARIDPDDFADRLDDRSHSPGLAVVDGLTTGSLETVADRDWVAVQLTAGMTYRIGLAGVEGGGGSLADPYVTLYDAAGQILAANDDIEYGLNLDSALDFIATESGTYYVEAASFDDIYAGTYTIAVTGSKTIDDLITGLYAGYCLRAPDAAGEAYWVGQLRYGMTLAEIATSFAMQPECMGVYQFLASPDLVNQAAIRSFVGEIYANLFQRAPDSAGEAYWTGQLQSGSRPLGMAILDVISGAQGDDILVIENKVAVASYYLTQTFNRQVPMTSSSARDAVVGVGLDATSVEAGKTKVDIFISTALFAEILPVLGVGAISGSEFQA